MLKVPATEAGLLALRVLLAEGINVNVTLLFSLQRYREVLQAHLEGMEHAIATGKDASRIASVASFFLSRVDTMVDAELDRVAAEDEGRKKGAASLRGEAAIASARQAHAIFEEFIASARFREIARQGARPQRLLWASTGTKDPGYSDVKYVEELIGPMTVNTMPLKTIRAYDDHGNPAMRLTGHADDAAAKLQQLERLGIHLDDVTEELLRQGIDKFVKPYDSLIASLEHARRSALAAPGVMAHQRLERGA
jgi:transaldolase